MASDDMPTAECKWCGAEMSPAAESCPLCRRPAGRAATPSAEHGPGQAAGAEASTAGGDGLEPLGGMPPPPTQPVSYPPPVPAGTPPPAAQSNADRRTTSTDDGFVASLVGYVKEDPLFAALLGLIAIDSVYYFVTGHPVIGALAMLIFWGLLTFQYWVYIVVVVLTGFFLLQGILGVLFFSGGLGFGGFLENILGVGLQIAVLAILLNKSDRYI